MIGARRRALALLIAGAMALAGIGASGCGDDDGGPAEEAGQELDEAGQEAGQEAEEAGQEAEQAVEEEVKDDKEK